MGKENKLFVFIKIVILIGVVTFTIWFAYSKKEASQVTYNVSATLIKTVKEARLATAKFTYNGVAEMDNGKEVIAHIKYNATVKAGINLEEVDIVVNEEEKEILISMPEITLESTVVNQNELSFIPSDVSVDFKDALLACQKDVEEEANTSEELLKSAKENARSFLEALVYPIADKQGYSIVCQ